MSAQQIELMRAAVLRRRAAINELHFTYTNLLRMMPNLMRRSPEAVAQVLHDQFFKAGVLLKRLHVVSQDHGQSPQPTLCAEVATLLDRLFHADRSRNSKTIPGLRTVAALMAVRSHLTREWGKLMDTLPNEILPVFHAEVLDMQRHEVDQYHELAALQAIMHTAHGVPVEEHDRDRRTPPRRSLSAIG